MKVHLVMKWNSRNAGSQGVLHSRREDIVSAWQVATGAGRVMRRGMEMTTDEADGLKRGMSTG